MNALAQRLSLGLRGTGLTGKLIRGALGSAGVKAANALLSLAVAILLARALGAEGYGIYAFAFSLVTLLAVPAQLGLPPLLVREIAKYRYQEAWGPSGSPWPWPRRPPAWPSCFPPAPSPCASRPSSGPCR